jgi:hypothetical protein
VRFEELRIGPFARDLAELIRGAPPFDEGFAVFVASDGLTQKQETIERIADV